MSFGRLDRSVVSTEPRLGNTFSSVEDMLSRGGFPVASCFLVLVITAIYGAQTHLFTVTSTVDWLFYWCADIPQLTLTHHQFWRLLTSQFLHASVAHLVGNSIGLILAGAFLERIVGPLWLIIIFLVCGAGGDVIAAQFNSPLTASVGASGGIMGLFAFTMIARLFDHSDGDEWYQRTSLVFFRVILFNFMPSPHVNIVAHIGGAIFGGAAYMVISSWWDDDDDIPSYALQSLGILSTGFAFLIFVGLLIG